MPRKLNYLITGGLGFIGSNIAKIIIKKKNLGKCILVDNYSGYINPLRRSFNDFRKLRFNDINDKKTNDLIKKKNVFLNGLIVLILNQCLKLFKNTNQI